MSAHRAGAARPAPHHGRSDRPLALGVRLVRACERAFDRVFGPRANPLRQLGALCFWMLWIVVASGFWTYALYETSVAGAYASVQAMTDEQPLTSGLMRSLHRYASDALVVLSLLHLLRELLLGRFRGFRWYTWVSGVPLLPLLIASGLVGYWMVWDRLAQVSGVITFEWLAWLPGFGTDLVRNFVDPEAITDRFFSLLSFLHIGLPLLLLLGAWAHLLRLVKPHVQPVRDLAVGSTLMLAVWSLAWPARSLPMADLASWPQRIALDWWYLAVVPLADLAPGFTWFGLTLATAALLLLPWAPGGPAPAARVVASRLEQGQGSVHVQRRDSQQRVPTAAAASPRGRRGRHPRGSKNMWNPLRIFGQVLAYAAFAAVIGVFATWPAYSLLEPGQALLRLSFSHPGKVSTECRQRTPEELAKMQPQMRTPLDCQRERSPVQVRVVLDDRVLVDHAFPPSGLSRDGASSGYWRTPIAAGPHKLAVTLRDDVRPNAPVHQREAQLDVKPGQIVLIDFKPQQGGVVIR